MSARCTSRENRVYRLTCAMFQRPPFDPNAAARRRRGACDGRQGLARPAAVAAFARALRGSDPVQSASRLDGPVRPRQTWAAAALPQVFASSLTRTYQKGSNAIVPVDAKYLSVRWTEVLLPKTVVRISFGWPVTPPLSYGRQGVSGVPRACDRLQWEHRRRTGQRAKGQSEAARRGRS